MTDDSDDARIEMRTTKVMTINWDDKNDHAIQDLGR